MRKTLDKTKGEPLCPCPFFWCKLTKTSNPFATGPMQPAPRCWWHEPRRRKIDPYAFNFSFLFTHFEFLRNPESLRSWSSLFLTMYNLPSSVTQIMPLFIRIWRAYCLKSRPLTILWTKSGRSSPSSCRVLASLIPRALCCRKISITLNIALRPRKA